MVYEIKKSEKTVVCKVPKRVVDGLKRVFPDEKGYNNRMRFNILWQTSLPRLENFLMLKNPKPKSKLKHYDNLGVRSFDEFK